jgi:hypothetical protein
MLESYVPTALVLIIFYCLGTRESRGSESGDWLEERGESLRNGWSIHCQIRSIVVKKAPEPPSWP